MTRGGVPPASPAARHLAKPLCAVVLLVLTAAAQPAPAATATPADAIPCADFQRNDDGSWTAKRVASVAIGRSHVSVAANTSYGPRAINLNGVDFAAFLTAHCGTPQQTPPPDRTR